MIRRLSARPCARHLRGARPLVLIGSIGLSLTILFAPGPIASSTAARRDLAAGSLDQAEEPISAIRLPQNPLVTVKSSPSLGDNVNGPAIVRVPSWIKQPLGRYYMYFAHHKGAFIRLAYADAIGGPWKVYEPGVLHVRYSAFYRPQPDDPRSPDGFYTHVASPEIFLDPARNKVVMWFHGWWTNGERWPIESAAAARAWAREHQYGQFTQVAESDDGIRFEIRSPITKESYLRVFLEGSVFYGLARLGLLLRSSTPLSAFEVGPNPFRDGLYAGRVRHVALLRRGRTLNVFFTAIGDAPERVLMASIDLTGDWQSWKASRPRRSEERGVG